MAWRGQVARHRRRIPPRRISGRGHRPPLPPPRRGACGRPLVYATRGSVKGALTPLTSRFVVCVSLLLSPTLVFSILFLNHGVCPHGRERKMNAGHSGPSSSRVSAFLYPSPLQSSNGYLSVHTNVLSIIVYMSNYFSEASALSTPASSRPDRQTGSSGAGWFA